MTNLLRYAEYIFMLPTYWLTHLLDSWQCRKFNKKYGIKNDA